MPISAVAILLGPYTDVQRRGETRKLQKGILRGRVPKEDFIPTANKKTEIETLSYDCPVTNLITLDVVLSASHDVMR